MAIYVYMKFIDLHKTILTQKISINETTLGLIDFIQFPLGCFLYKVAAAYYLLWCDSLIRKKAMAHTIVPKNIVTNQYPAGDDGVM